MREVGDEEESLEVAPSAAAELKFVKEAMAVAILQLVTVGVVPEVDDPVTRSHQERRSSRTASSLSHSRSAAASRVIDGCLWGTLAVEEGREDRRRFCGCLLRMSRCRGTRRRTSRSRMLDSDDSKDDRLVQSVVERVGAETWTAVRRSVSRLERGRQSSVALELVPFEL